MPILPTYIPIRKATIGKDTTIRRALPSKAKRTIGAWCFLDHAGPVHFKAGAGLDVGPHPHTGLQTFTWMLEGDLMHTDSLGNKQLIQPNQINLMSAGHGISHTEVTPAEYEGTMHTVQMWIAQPNGTGRGQRNGPARFDHYPNIPTIEQEGVKYTVLVGDFLGQTSPVEVATSMMGSDIQAQKTTTITLPLNPEFEYGLLLLKGSARIKGEAMNIEQLIYYSTGLKQLQIELEEGSHMILIGGEPFEAPIILWWNLVDRSSEEIHESTQQWLDQHERFGSIPDYPGERLTPPEIPAKLVASR